MSVLHLSKPFFVQLGYVCLATAAGLGVLYMALPDLQHRVGYLIALIIGFCVFTVLAQAVAVRIAAKPKASALINFVMVLTFVKMAFSLSLVYGYYLYARPASIHFLWPFFLTYLAFTSFETYALIKLSLPAVPSHKHVD